MIQPGDINFAQLNTWILSGVGLITAGGVIFTGFSSKAVREANGILKTELEASNARGDRLESDRNEYREKLHECQNSCQRYEVQNAELKVRTDFTPVMKFQEKWYAEQAEVTKQTLQVLARVAAVLDRIEPKLHA